MGSRDVVNYHKKSNLELAGIPACQERLKMRPMVKYRTVICHAAILALGSFRLNLSQELKFMISEPNHSIEYEFGIDTIFGFPTMELSKVQWRYSTQSWDELVTVTVTLPQSNNQHWWLSNMQVDGRESDKITRSLYKFWRQVDRNRVRTYLVHGIWNIQSFHRHASMSCHISVHFPKFSMILDSIVLKELFLRMDIFRGRSRDVFPTILVKAKYHTQSSGWKIIFVSCHDTLNGICSEYLFP